MSDTKDFDQVSKTVTKLIDDWGKAIQKIAKDLKEVQDQIDKMEALKKQRDGLAKDADAASKDLSGKIEALKIPPKTDPQQILKLPDIITKNITKNGVKLGDYGSVKPDVDIDFKKMEVKKAVIVWTWDW